LPGCSLEERSLIELGVKLQKPERYRLWKITDQADDLFTFRTTGLVIHKQGYCQMREFCLK
ncbi:MAG: hypothetical protein JAY94_17240, partial [Candidatus Thiodiazotropha endolucinida]|nr:hypothetical protein [Candidatus Thiodiazotropha taylori]MCW4319259.1 hypothetical protein [Candidatus Thiodiazotropha taylori]